MLCQIRLCPLPSGTQGCTIYQQGEAVFVGKLLKGCDAELSGKIGTFLTLPLPVTNGHTRISPPYFPMCSAEVLREGDELLEVNGVPVMARSTDEIVRLMVSYTLPGNRSLVVFISHITTRNWAALHSS